MYFDHTKSSSHLQVTEPCKMRTPNYFIITVMNSGRTVNTTTVPHDHQSGSQVTTEIELPQNVDMCGLVVSIRAGNSAGMSSPTEIEVGRSHHDRIKLPEYCYFLCMQNVPLHVTTQTALLILPALELIQILLSLMELNKKIMQ